MMMRRDIIIQLLFVRHKHNPRNSTLHVSTLLSSIVCSTNYLRLYYAGDDDDGDDDDGDDNDDDDDNRECWR